MAIGILRGLSTTTMLMAFQVSRWKTETIGFFRAIVGEAIVSSGG